MSVKRTGQLSFVEALMPAGWGANERLDRLTELVKWYRFEKLLDGIGSEGPGRPGYRPLAMFKALLLQSLYGLSDAELEAAVLDRLSFRRFVGLSLEDAFADHTTLCRFRNRLIEEGRLEKMFAELDRQLDKAGLILRRGTMLDATLIETGAAGKPSGDAPPVDPEAAFAGRPSKSRAKYGYKAHVAVDQGSGLIRRVITTPANINDTTPADDLIMGDERVVWGDSAYHTHGRQAALQARGVKARLMRRPNKHHPKLPPRLARYNRLIARRRAAVETTFATWKRRMNLRAIRYIGLKKAAGQILMATMAFNMRRWVTLAPA
jgi:IS5 family transposase